MVTTLRPESPPRRSMKNSMHELKLRRILENNARLKEDLARPRIRVSEASLSLIRFCQETRDPLLPSVWGEPKKGEDPYQPPEAGCCIGGRFAPDPKEQDRTGMSLARLHARLQARLHSLEEIYAP